MFMVAIYRFQFQSGYGLGKKYYKKDIESFWKVGNFKESDNTFASL